MKTLRTALAVSLLTLVSGVSGVALAASKHPADATCTPHVKKMQGMKTSAERTAYCKGDEECASHHCAKLVSHHAKKKAENSAPKTATH